MQRISPPKFWVLVNYWRILYAHLSRWRSHFPGWTRKAAFWPPSKARNARTTHNRTHAFSEIKIGRWLVRPVGGLSMIQGLTIFEARWADKTAGFMMTANERRTLAPRVSNTQPAVASASIANTRSPLAASSSTCRKHFQWRVSEGCLKLRRAEMRWN